MGGHDASTGLEGMSARKKSLTLCTVLPLRYCGEWVRPSIQVFAQQSGTPVQLVVGPDAHIAVTGRVLQPVAEEVAQDHPLAAWQAGVVGFGGDRQ